MTDDLVDRSYVVVNRTRKELHGGANYAVFGSAAEAAEAAYKVQRSQGASSEPDELEVAELALPDRHLVYEAALRDALRDAEQVYGCALLGLFAVEHPWWRPFARRWWRAARAEVSEMAAAIQGGGFLDEMKGGGR